jgi:meso-butanediol dehydrogenase / (S,S)-butanediol dehydrogenase / diacetyl reductase
MEAGMSQTQRIAIVTAAGGGIGRATALALLQQGLTVIAVDRDRAALDALHGAADSERLLAVVADATDPAAAERAVFDATRLGGLHVLVNGVGSTCSGGIRELSLQTWREKFELNLTSVFVMTQAALPLLRATHGDRVVINLSSSLAAVADPQTIAYSAFKAALEQMTRCLALDLAADGVRAVAVAPGPVAATGGEAEFESPEYARLTPLRRFATTDEIAAMIAFVASPAASYVSGTTVRVDGGDSAFGAGWGALEPLLRGDR